MVMTVAQERGTVWEESAGSGLGKIAAALLLVKVRALPVFCEIVGIVVEWVGRTLRVVLQEGMWQVSL